jgi:hypothetical protein
MLKLRFGLKLKFALWAMYCGSATAPSCANNAPAATSRHCVTVPLALVRFWSARSHSVAPVTPPGSAGTDANVKKSPFAKSIVAS